MPAHTVSRNGEEVKLTPLEFDLLVALARKPRQVFTREVLLEQVWGYRHAADTRLVNVHVQRLRAKIERIRSDPKSSSPFAAWATRRVPDSLGRTVATSPIPDLDPTSRRQGAGWELWRGVRADWPDHWRGCTRPGAARCRCGW